MANSSLWLTLSYCGQKNNIYHFFVVKTFKFLPLILKRNCLHLNICFLHFKINYGNHVNKGEMGLLLRWSSISTFIVQMHVSTEKVSLSFYVNFLWYWVLWSGYLYVLPT
jgi:hypothetical protein